MAADYGFARVEETADETIPLAGDWARELHSWRVTESLDACFAPGGPVEWLKARKLGVFTGSGEGEWSYAEVLDLHGTLLGYSKHMRSDPARAVCEATLAAAAAMGVR